jgi:hypothetical protein
VTPSTSFSGAIALNAARSSMWSSRSVPISSAVAVVVERATCREVMPASRQWFWLYADVGHGRRVLADQHGREARRGAGAPGERGGLPRGVLHDAAGERGAVHQTGAWVWAGSNLLAQARAADLTGRSPVVLHLSASHGSCAA